MNILCDMDGILVDLLGPWLAAIKQDLGVEILIKEIKSWEMMDHPLLGQFKRNDVYKFLQSKDAFWKLPPLAGALEGVKALQENGHNVVIVSRPAGPSSARDKLRWIDKHLPWLPRHNVWIGHHKHMIKGDMIIDDSPDVLLEYVNEWPQARAFAIAYPYNQNLDNERITLVPAFYDTEQAWRAIVNMIGPASHRVEFNEWGNVHDKSK